MRKAGFALLFIVVAALAYAVVQPTRVYLVRQRFYGQGLAWSARDCTRDAECVTVGCWPTSRKNPGMSQLQHIAKELGEFCQASVVRCANSVCVAGP